MNGPIGSPSLEQPATRDSSWRSFCFGTLESPNRHFICARALSPVNCLTEIFPQLRGWGEAPCRPFSVEAIAESGAGVAFLATPHEASLELVPQLLDAGLRVVDLSGAFRFRDPETFRELVQVAGARCGAAGPGRLRPAGTVWQCSRQREIGRQSRAAIRPR